LTAAPETHSLLFENAAVCVISTRIAPGETTALHTHCWPQVSESHASPRELLALA
jgi:hypothetical protein